ncbi:Putative methyltransferase [Musa troglodytarum]|uniref:tRNA (guanine(46)-N(7))-methyltransferase n=1 Tax=Musa troglodytarum TaxID=320322 RepID=A0A9E7G6H6_9LILI|nr:Putative methyltransferase [Musa troglodytarum]
MLVFGCTGSGWCAAHALGSAASAMASSPFLRIAPTLHLRRCCRRFWSEEPKEEGATNGWTRRRSTIAAQRSPDVVEMEYADLNLKNFYGAAPNLGHIRIRQHVNPLSSSFATPAEIPVWKEVFRDPSLPLMLDIGSGSGRFLLWLAKNCPERRNYLGLEIRQKLVERSQFWAEELGLANIHFMFANATVSFEPLVSTYPGPLMLVSILVSFIQISFPILESNKEIVLDTANSQAICHYFEVRQVFLFCIMQLFLCIEYDQILGLIESLCLHSILQCPDPYFKKRHHKRRVVQASLVDSISKRLSIRGQVWLV